jgi:aryl-alcohol dehydrogenase-like predicted oxidoreductase
MHEDVGLVCRAVAGNRDDYMTATKFARRVEPTTRPGDISTIGPLDEYVRRSIDGSLRRLATDHVDLYYQDRGDPNNWCRRVWHRAREAAGID